MNLCFLMMKILSVIHIFTCIWIFVGNLEHRQGNINWLDAI
jgi:hypothetical protein